MRPVVLSPRPLRCWHLVSHSSAPDNLCVPTTQLPDLLLLLPPSKCSFPSTNKMSSDWISCLADIFIRQRKGQWTSASPQFLYENFSYSYHLVQKNNSNLRTTIFFVNEHWPGLICCRTENHDRSHVRTFPRSQTMLKASDIYDHIYAETPPTATASEEEQAGRCRRNWLFKGWIFYRRSNQDPFFCFLSLSEHDNQILSVWKISFLRSRYYSGRWEVPCCSWRVLYLHFEDYIGI